MSRIYSFRTVLHLIEINSRPVVEIFAPPVNTKKKLGEAFFENYNIGDEVTYSDK